MHVSLNNIRTINFHGIRIGGENSFPILNPVFVLNIPVSNLSDNFSLAQKYFNSDDLGNIIDKANSSSADIIGLKFNIGSLEEVDSAVNIIKNIFSYIKKPVLISGCGNDSIDAELLPELLKYTDREVIVNGACENNYKFIVPAVIKGNHVLVLKTPIDINLAKELNILSSDLGLSLDKILIDTDIGGLGYGLEYGYSIMEKIKLEGLNGDKYLNMPIISFACYEALKTKEAKTEMNDICWGDIEKRAKFFELTAASAVMACGANVIVMNYPPNISVMKGLIK